MNVPGQRATPAPTLLELRAELEHLIEANETTRLLLRDACTTLAGVVETHLDQADAQVRRLIGELHRRR